MALLRNVGKWSGACCAALPALVLGSLNAQADDAATVEAWTAARELSSVEAADICARGGPAINVTINNIRKTKGSIVADLHDDDPQNFLKEIVRRVRTPVEADAVSFCLPVTRTGEFALAVYHDKNNNRKFDKNFLGIPKELFGVSNNPKYSKAAPSYEESAFEVTADGADIVIRLVGARDIMF